MDKGSLPIGPPSLRARPEGEPGPYHMDGEPVRNLAMRVSKGKGRRRAHGPDTGIASPLPADQDRTPSHRRIVGPRGPPP